jgi:hypothetical protein
VSGFGHSLLRTHVRDLDGALVIQTAHPIAGFEKIVGDSLASINPNLTVVKFQKRQPSSLRI